MRKFLQPRFAARWLSGLAIAALVAALLPAAAQPSSSCPADAPDYAAIDRYVREQMRDCRIPGLALGIVRGDQVLYLKGYGVADESGRPVTAQTPFVIASLSKTFTALALMQLKDAGAVDLDAPVRRYLVDGDPAYGIYEEMTVRQLLNHTSGLAAQLEYQVTGPQDSDISSAELVRRFGAFPLARPPGTRFEYGNAGYIVLGELISRVSGLSYAEYLQRNILGPLEMRHSYASAQQAAQDGPAVGYRAVFGYPRVSGLVYQGGYVPALGIMSSAEDLSHYMIALLNGGMYKGARILSAEGVAEMLSPSSSVSPYIDYGLGWYVTSGSFYHGGELTDYQAKLKVLPEDRLGVVFLYNTSSSTANMVLGVGYREKIETGIINILYGASPSDQPGQSPLDLNSYPMALTYHLLVALAALAVLLLALSARRLRTLSERLAESRSRFWSILAGSALANILLPLYILLAVPQRSVSWAYMLHYNPDVGWFALILAALLVALGIGKGVVIAVFLARRRYPEY